MGPQRALEGTAKYLSAETYATNSDTSIGIFDTPSPMEHLQSEGLGENQPVLEAGVTPEDPEPPQTCLKIQPAPRLPHNGTVKESTAE